MAAPINFDNVMFRAVIDELDSLNHRFLFSTNKYNPIAV